MFRLGFAVGFVAGAAALFAPQLAKQARPAAKAALKAALMTLHEVQVRGAETVEAAEDLYVEAKAEVSEEIAEVAAANETVNSKRVQTAACSLCALSGSELDLANLPRQTGAGFQGSPRHSFKGTPQHGCGHESLYEDCC